ncbi:MAG: GLPGLI family protein [Bacteroidota bacterium]
MKLFLIILATAGFALNSQAQQSYIVKGKIEYEKVVNSLKVLDEMMTGENNVFADAFRKTMPKTSSTYWDMYFNNDKSLYKPGREVVVTQKAPDWINGPASDNIVFNDLSRQTSISQKTVFEGTYLIQDSLRNLNWKITNDTRTIAGLECRKATAIMMDSVFVVAFFTEQILCTSGPEGFNGLPGMILGIAIPRLHTTWYATKLELIEVKDTDIAAPKKGKVSTNSQLQQQLKNLIKDAGSRGHRMMWQVTI